MKLEQKDKLKLKITKQELKQIIREELQKEGFLDKLKGVFW